MLANKFFFQIEDTSKSSMGYAVQRFWTITLSKQSNGFIAFGLKKHAFKQDKEVEHLNRPYVELNTSKDKGFEISKGITTNCQQSQDLVESKIETIEVLKSVITDKYLKIKKNRTANQEFDDTLQKTVTNKEIVNDSTKRHNKKNKPNNKKINKKKYALLNQKTTEDCSELTKELIERFDFIDFTKVPKYLQKTPKSIKQETKKDSNNAKFKQSKRNLEINHSGNINTPIEFEAKTVTKSFKFNIKASEFKPKEKTQIVNKNLEFNINAKEFKSEQMINGYSQPFDQNLQFSYPIYFPYMIYEVFSFYFKPYPFYSIYHGVYYYNQ